MTPKALATVLLAELLSRCYVVAGSIEGHHVAGVACTSALNCSLNGDCVQGQCICDAAWSGSPNCDVLSILPEPTSGPLGYKNDSYSSWGGNTVKVDGTYHLFVAQFAKHCELGDWGTNSEIIRATSTDPAGPFEYQETIIEPFAHNPTIRELPNGSGFVLFMIGGTPSIPKDCNGTANITREITNRSVLYGTGIRVSWAPAVTGPWTKPTEVNFTDRSSLLYGGGTNPSPHIHPDGSVTLAYQMQPEPPHNKWELVGVAHAASWKGPYTQNSPNPITPPSPLCLAGREEDPFLWKSKRGWHIISHGMCPSGLLMAHHRFSEDSITWYDSPHETYQYTVDYENSSEHFYYRVERPQLAFETYNPQLGTFDDPTTLYNGVCNGLSCITTQTGITYTLARQIKKPEVSSTPIKDNPTPISPDDTFQGLVTKLGYPFEQHTAVTTDGYELTLFRLPANRSGSPAIILQHGILASAWCWIDREDPNRAVAFRLWHLGYDVWLSNSRGNTYSRNSTVCPVNSVQFWNYTFVDMAFDDVPTNVDYVLNTTGLGNVSFAGWSQGNTQFMIAALTNPSLASKINLYMGVSPVVYLQHTTSLLLKVLSEAGVASAVYDVWQKGFLDGSISPAEELLCKISLGELCKIGVDAICGESDLDDKNSIENFAAHFPAGTSVKDMLHYAQYVDEGRFEEFDYGTTGNKRIYNQPTPPMFNLSHWPIGIPLALFLGTEDALVAPEDTTRMLTELSMAPRNPIVFSKLYEGFSHITWFAGVDLASYWLDDLVSNLAKYNPAA